MLRGLLVLTVAALAARAATAADPPTPGRLITKVYSVADLVVPFPMQGEAKLPPLGQFRPLRPALETEIQQASATEPAPTGFNGTPNADAIMKLITQTIHPYSWQEMGGPGKLDYYDLNHTLVVNQTAAGQADVAEFLATLRRVQRKGMPQVSLEVRVVEVPETLFEQVSIGCPNCCDKGECKQAAPLLCAKQVQELLTAAQTDARVNVMMAPKMTVMDGQRACICVEEQQTFQTGLDLSAGPDGVIRKPRYETVNVGTRIAATPTVSADRHAVKLKFRYESAKLGRAAAVVPVSVGDASRTEKPADLLARPAVERQEIERELTIPAGKTAMLLGPKVERQCRAECGTATLSNFLQSGRLRKIGTCSMSCRQLILVTPRVLATEECPKAQAAKLVAAYRKACADGRTEEAMKCAMQALAKDPHCFAEQK